MFIKLELETPYLIFQAMQREDLYAGVDGKYFMIITSKSSKRERVILEENDLNLLIKLLQQIKDQG